LVATIDANRVEDQAEAARIASKIDANRVEDQAEAARIASKIDANRVEDKAEMAKMLAAMEFRSNVMFGVTTVISFGSGYSAYVKK